MLFSLFIALVASAIVTQIAVFGTTIYLHRTATHMALTLHPASEVSGRRIVFHGHCHQKALIGMVPSMGILKQANLEARESGAGCCGMAGSFGYETEHYEVSRKIGEERLFPCVRSASDATVIGVAGVSCRQQIEHFTGRTVKHIAEILAEQVRPRCLH